MNRQKKTKYSAAYQKTAYDVIDLIRRCFEPSDVPEAPPSEGDYSRFYAVSKAMGMQALAIYALQSAGIKDPEYDEVLAMAQRRSILYDAEYAQLSAALSKAGICHCPLKGMIVKGLYPSVGLREMTDMDVWFDDERADDVKSIMTGLGYRADRFGKSNHDVYVKQPIFCVEMHRHLIDEGVLPDCCAYYDGFRETLPGEGPALYQSREDAYIYMTVHTYKHYVMAGVGARALLDTYVMLKQWGGELDLPYIEGECRKLGINDFEHRLRRVSEHLFSRDELDEEERAWMDGFVCSEVHGNLEGFYYNSVKRKVDDSGKLSYIRARLKTPDAELQEHPLLRRSKCLRPLYAPVRFVKALIKRPGYLSKELRTLSQYKKNTEK